MAHRLFEGRPPSEGDRILYPGAGKAPFAVAVEKLCLKEGWPLPEGVGIENDPELLAAAQEKNLRHVDFEKRDFLGPEMKGEKAFDYVLGNPPYVPIEGLSDKEKARYRSEFRTARGRFDLYLLFFERALQLLCPGGRLTFVTPEKWEYVETAAPLRRMMTAREFHVEEIHHIKEDAFKGLITFPSVTTIRRGEPGDTKVTPRNGNPHQVTLPEGGKSWAASVRGADLSEMETGLTLGEVTVRVSPGMATGADGTFVQKRSDVPSALKPEWIRPTVSGKELSSGDSPRSESVFICPYRDDGTLQSKAELGAFGEWASEHRERLEDRSCVKKAGKKWYAWHETPPMEDLLRPKIVFKDIAKEPRFWAEREGDVVPRHTVYYTVPEQGVSFDGLLEYLNGPLAQEWIEANCQRAANGFLRLQSRVLRKLPVPREVIQEQQGVLAL